MASSDFTRAMAGKKAAIQKMREVQKNNFEQPTIQDGTYVVGVAANCGSTEKGVPYVRIDWVIQDEGEQNGKGWNATYWLDDEDPERDERNYSNLARAFMAILDVEEVCLDDGADIEQLIDMINQEKIYVKAKIVTKDGKNGKKYINTYWQKRVEV